MPVAEIMTEKAESEVNVKLEPPHDHKVVSIAFDPWKVKPELSLVDYESWPRLEVKVKRLEHGNLSSTVAVAASFRCTRCPKVFHAKTSLSYHIKAMHLGRLLRCKICDFKTPSNQHFKRHEIAHTARPGCSICHRPVVPKLMEHHLRQHSENYIKPPPRPCEICGQLFTSSSAISLHWKKCHSATHGSLNAWKLKNHVKIPTEQKSFQCNICSFKTSKNHRLNEHKRDHLTKEECKICRKPCSERFMVFHMKSHSQISGASTKPRHRIKKAEKIVKIHEKGPFTCDRCGKVYVSRQSIMDHLKGHFPQINLECKPQVITQCPCCYKTFDVEVLEKHILKNHRRHNFKCSECEETFIYFEKLRVHSLKTHYGGELHECHCGAVYKNKYDLNRHKKAHDPPITCEVCSRIYADRDSLYNHWRKHHFNTHGFFGDWRKSQLPSKEHVVPKKRTSIAPKILEQNGVYTCDCCEKAFASRGLLVNHVKNHANLYQQYQLQSKDPQVPTACPCCYKIFDKNILENHISKSHRRENFQCRQCEESFSYSESLRMHVLKTHYEGELHVCHCGAVYKNKYDLNHHKKAHDPPITCDICSRIFEDKDSLYLHWRFTHYYSYGSLADWKRAHIPKAEQKVERIEKRILKFPVALKQEGPYTCDFCDQKCAHRNSIYSHLHYYHFRNANSSILKRVKKSKFGNSRTNIILNHPGPYFCDKCGREQKNRRSFLEHIGYMHRTQPSVRRRHVCSDCGEAFHLRNALRTHQLESHYEGELFKCYCGSVFKDKSGLKQHETVHGNAKFECKLCNYASKHKRHFTRHWQEAHFESKGSYAAWKESIGLNKTRRAIILLDRIDTLVLDQNGKLLSNWESILEQERLSSVKKAKKLKKSRKVLRSLENVAPQETTSCPCCYKTFDVKVLERHIKKTHRRHNFKCRECGESFLYSEKLRIHSLKTHYEGKLHECHCGAVYKNEYDLNYHQKAHDPPITCGVCNRILADKDSLYNHWKTWHFKTHGAIGDWRKSQTYTKILKQNGVYTCDCCGKAFASRITLVHHVKHHANLYQQYQQLSKGPQEPTSCPYCYKIFDKNILENHIRKGHRNHSFKCRDCEESFSYFEPLRMHILKKHYEGELHECHCGAVYKNKYDLNHHKKAHDPPITCDICSRIFEDKDSLYLHWRFTHYYSHGSLVNWKRAHMPKAGKKVERIKKTILKFPVALKQEGPYTCDICDQKFAHRGSIYNHLHYYHFRNANASNHKKKVKALKFPIILKQRGPYFCDVCAKECASRSSVMNHLRYSHFLAPYLNCPECPETFNMRSLLQSHIQKCHPSAFEASNYLTVQLRERKAKTSFVKDLLSQDQTCNECGESFELKTKLHRHFLKEHYEGKVFECDCGAVFKKQRSLQAHEYLHTEKARDCEACGQTFKGRSSLYGHWLDKHLKTLGSRSAWRQSMGMPALKKKTKRERRKCAYPALKHPGPYTCDVCGLVAKNRSSLQVHLKYRHFLQNFLFCELCPKSFNMKSVFKSHMESHNRVKIERTKTPKIRTSHPRILKKKMIKIFNCKECDKKCYSHDQLRDHVLRNHYTGPLHECHCGKVFKSKERLTEHQWVHGDKFNCELCGKTLKCEKYKYGHWSANHATEHGSYSNWKISMGLATAKPSSAMEDDGPQETTTCPCCYKTFDVKALDKHIEKTHPKKNYKCRDCDETYDYSEKLRIHTLQQHFGGVLHECHCGSVYKTEYDLNQHQKAHDPPVTCEVCSKIFVDKFALYRHWKARHFGTYGAYGDWVKNQHETLLPSDFLIADIQSGWDGLDSDFDGETYCSDDEEISYKLKSENSAKVVNLLENLSDETKVNMDIM